MEIEPELFRKIPRNDILFYLHQHTILNSNIKIVDIYERINKPTYVFCLIIDDLLRLKFISVNNYQSLKERGSFFPEKLKNTEIMITDLGKDYLESMVLGYNTKKYDSRYSPTDTIQIMGFTGSLSLLYKKTYNDFEKFRSITYDPKLLYYLCTGKDFKENNEKKVFISYSWDSENHKQWVSNLAKKLGDNFNIEYDKNLKYAMSPQNYMKHNILSSDFIIIIFTPDYLKKIEMAGSGVQIEYHTIENYLINNELFRKIPYGKYLSLLKDGSKEKSIPETMRDSIYFDFRNNENYNTEIKNLITYIEKN